MLWYCSYGSNLSQERFLKYICGGTLDARSSSKFHPGCRDKTLPQRCVFKYLPHVEVYFARKSSSWQGGGVGFVRQKKNKHADGTVARMYLVTEEQFYDIVGQENGYLQSFITRELQPKLQNIIDKLHTETTDDRFDMHRFMGGYYDSIVYLGQHEDYPILTFTNSDFKQKPECPSKEYLQTITNGLKQSANEMNEYSTTEKCIDYLLKKRGVDGNWTREELLKELK